MTSGIWKTTSCERENPFFSTIFESFQKCNFHHQFLLQHLNFAQFHRSRVNSLHWNQSSGATCSPFGVFAVYSLWTPPLGPDPGHQPGDKLKAFKWPHEEPLVHGVKWRSGLNTPTMLHHKCCSIVAKHTEAIWQTHSEDLRPARGRGLWGEGGITLGGRGCVASSAREMLHNCS